MSALLVMLLAAAPAAHADEALRDEVVALLSGYEAAPTPAQWRALGAGADVELRAVATDPAYSPTRRAGAVFALGAFPTEVNHRFLADLVAEGEPLLRRKAVYALGLGWGDDALDALEPALGAPDVQLRAAAARALGRIGTAGARDALRARLAAETDATVQDALRAGLEGK